MCETDINGAVLTVRESPSTGWSAFVDSHPDATLYHSRAWLDVAKAAFGCRTYYVESFDSTGVVAGVLPLVRQKTLLFGDRLTSLPFCNYGGPLAHSPAVAQALMERATKLATDLGVRELEFRDRAPRAGAWETRTEKVTFLLQLPKTSAELERVFGSKLRSQIRRADRERLAIRRGGRELVEDFYRVFSENMRDVGTPVYPRCFFEAVVTQLDGQYEIVVLDLAGTPAAAGLLLFHRSTAEIPWAAATMQAKAHSLNMRLYWELLSASIQRGTRTFDFGRSSRGSGTYRFKQQWGAAPMPLYWHRWPAESGDIESNRNGRARTLATRLWKRLPLWASNRIGPLISPGLPW